MSINFSIMQWALISVLCSEHSLFRIVQWTFICLYYAVSIHFSVLCSEHEFSFTPLLAPPYLWTLLWFVWQSAGRNRPSQNILNQILVFKQHDHMLDFVGYLKIMHNNFSVSDLFKGQTMPGNWAKWLLGKVLQFFITILNTLLILSRHGPK